MVCGPGSACLYAGQDPAGRRYYACLDACAVADSRLNPHTSNCDCRDGYECSLTAEVCLPGCSNNRECCEIWRDGDRNGNTVLDTGEEGDRIRQAREVTLLPPDECTDTCDLCWTYQCSMDGCPGGLCQIGGMCEHDSDCPADTRCLTEWNYEFDGGYCLKDRCDLSGRDCPTGSGCAELGRDFQACVPTCEVGTQPGDTGYECRDVGEVGVPDTGDHACSPISYTGGTTATGFCWYGNFAGGTVGLNQPCTDDPECNSPLGLGACFSLRDQPPNFCSVSCIVDPAVPNRQALAARLCGAPAIPTDPAPAACVGGLCVATCDLPGAPLGSNGCPANMACYSFAGFLYGTVIAPDAAAPRGLCWPRCPAVRGNAWCTDIFDGRPGFTVCSTSTGICGG